MIEIKQEDTRILLGNSRRRILDKMIYVLLRERYDEIFMFNTDSKNAFVGMQKLSSTYFKNAKDVRLFYIQNCFRGENDQFTQVGVDILNPTMDYTDHLIYLAKQLIMCYILPVPVKWLDNVYYPTLKINKDVTKGLDYYTEGKGFEISYDLLEAQKQLCGGGAYEGGIGFTLGLDRILLIDKGESDE